MKTRQISMLTAFIVVFCAVVSVSGSSVANCDHYKIDSRNITRCTICVATFQLNLNYTKCLPCERTLPHCLRCDQDAHGTLGCQACADGYRIDGASCTNIDGCEPHCTHCTQTWQCTACDPGYFLTRNASCSPCPAANQLDQGNGTCSCDSGSYLALPTNSCEPCEYPCQTCQGSPSVCTVCIYGFYMAESSTGRCGVCLAANCILCGSGGACVNCTLGYRLAGGRCVAQLEQQNIDNYINLPEFYYFCLPGCFYCYKYDFCITCLQGYSRDLYTDDCRPCATGCLRCEALLDMRCFACEQGYRLEDSSCLPCSDHNCLNCPKSTASCLACSSGFTAVNGSCLPCAANCGRCDRAGSGGCDENSCLSGYARVSNTTCALCALGCYSCSPVDITTCISCPVGSFQVAGGQCQICPSACVACQSSSVCSTCRQGHRLVGSLCYEDCSFPCLECSPFNARICSSCFDGYRLAEDMSCQPDVSCNADSNCTICPVGYYLDLYTGVCSTCQLQPYCLKCETEASKCAICAAGYYLLENSCLPCSASCLTCQLFSFCFSCKPGYFLAREDSAQLYGQCRPCAANCLTCIDEVAKCSSCNYTQTLIGFECVTTQNIIFQITLQNPTLSNPNAEQYAFIKQIVAFTRALADAFGAPYSEHPELLYLKDISSGSIQVSYMATVADLDPRILLHTITTALESFTGFGGFTVISTQIVTNGFQNDVVMEPSSAYLAVALAPSPLFLLFLAFVGRRFLRREGEEGEEDEGGVEEALEVRLEPMETGKSLRAEQQGAITL